MLEDMILTGSFLLYVGALVYLVLARKWDERRERFTRTGAALGVAAALVTLVINLIVVFSPDLNDGSREFYFLVFLALIFPMITLTGGILALFQVRYGVPVLVTGISLWMINSLLGFLALITGTFD